MLLKTITRLERCNLKENRRTFLRSLKAVILTITRKLLLLLFDMEFRATEGR